VNSDPEREAARQTVARHRLNWRSWWAGGPDGDIPARWHIAGYPSMFLIDARGVIRFEQLHAGPELENAIEALLRETP
jgi:hypothetical protein